MGLCIEYTIKIKDKESIATLFNAARAEAKRLKWKVARGSTSRMVEFLPHPECEAVRLDFTDGLTTNETVKTSFAPPEVHIAICTFLRAIKTHCLALRVSDECGYWPKFNQKALLEARGEFGEAFDHYKADPSADGAKTTPKKPSSRRAKPADQDLPSQQPSAKPAPMVFTLGAAIVTADGKIKQQKGQRIVVQGE